MIQLRHQQASLWEGWLAEEVAELWETAAAEPHARAAAEASGSSPAHIDPEARAQLELRDWGTGSTRQCGVPEFLPDWHGESAAGKGAASPGAGDGTRDHPRIT